MKFKLIALDVDGTLLDDHHRLSEATITSVRRANEAGSTIVLCTGRGPSGALPVFAELGLSGQLITHNGSATISSEGPSVVHQFPMEMADIMPLIEYCRAKDVHFDVNSALQLYVEAMTPVVEEMYRNFFVDPVVLKDITEITETVVKFTAFGTKEEMDRVEADWNEMKIKGRMIRSGEYFIDVMHNDSSKGNALKALADGMNIPAENILAIGNYFNDIDMLEFAGFGIAMDNSPDAVKRAADAVTKSNNEDGVHSALLQYCLKD